MATEDGPDEFYAKLYYNLKEQFEERQLPISSVGFGPKHLFSARTALSGRPVYLAIKYQDLSYYVYAAPAPGGLFVSSWLFSKYTIWEGHALMQAFMAWRQFRQTIFQADMMELFHGIAHGALTDTVDSYREEDGLAPLEEYEKRPVLHSFYARMKNGSGPNPNGFVMPVGQGDAPQQQRGEPVFPIGPGAR